MNEQVTARFSDLDDFLKCFASNISWAKQKDIIQDEFLNTTHSNYDNMTHARIQALIIKTGFDLDYVVGTEVGFKPTAGAKFKADALFWKSDDLRFLIEYESTNSADRRILKKDLQHYVDSLENEISKKYPKYWLIIYTFPDFAVDSCDWNSGDYYKNYHKYDIMRRNPHRFYKEGFRTPSKLGLRKLVNHPGISKFTNCDGWQMRKLFFINLTVKGLEIDFPEHFAKKYQFRHGDG